MRIRYRPPSEGQRSESHRLFHSLEEKSATPSGSCRKTASCESLTLCCCLRSMRFLKSGGRGVLAIARLNAFSPASRYLSKANEEMCCAEPTVSKPFEETSCASTSLNSPRMPSRSQMVCSYSLRFNFRSTVLSLSRLRAGTVEWGGFFEAC